MAAVAKGVALGFGLLSAPVSLHGATEPKISNKQVCVGVDEPHEVARISQVRTCATCGPVPYEQIRKAREVGGALVLLEDTEISEAQSDATLFKKRIDLTPHPSEQVEVSTVAGDKLYFLVPEAGGEQAYALLRHAVGDHPELSFMAQWTPRSAAGLYVLRVHRGCLVLQERQRTEQLRAVPQVEGEAPEAMVGMLEQLLAVMVTDFDPATYADTYAARIAEIVAARTPTSVPEKDATPRPAAANAAMDALAAMLAATQVTKESA